LPSECIVEMEKAQSRIYRMFVDLGKLERPWGRGQALVERCVGCVEVQSKAGAYYSAMLKSTER
jgi:hypothetical protein